MKSIFNSGDAEEIKGRILNVRPQSARQWGTMDSAQALAHCSAGMRMAAGELKPPRMFIGRIMGSLIKRLALKDGQPFKRNSPTAPELRVKKAGELESEKRGLIELIDGFTRSGRAACTTHPHTFFGRMTPDEWGVLMYKHLDHHLRQFSA